MKVNIASSNRFHLLDLARELDKQGYDVKFYSFVPSKRCEHFGLPQRCCISMLWFVAPFYVLMKVFGNKGWIIKYRNLCVDYYMSWFMRPCDVYIALGTVYKTSIISAKNRFGAKTILEWGSMHIDDQQKILKECGAHLHNEYFNKRSRDGYDIADYIAIPAIHTKNSFVTHGIPEEKLLQNPYGVDVSMFHPIKQEKKYDFIMVGNWTRQKGCDLIVEAIRQTGYSFLHVGALGDVPFPSDRIFTHIDPVNQSELIDYYNIAKVFLLPSRQEGLALVQVQALACNLPIVGSPNSGVLDLVGLVEHPEYIFTIKDWTVPSITEVLSQALLASAQLKGEIYAGNALSKLTWEAYGNRYNDYLLKITRKNEIK